MNRLRCLGNMPFLLLSIAFSFHFMQCFTNNHGDLELLRIVCDGSRIFDTYQIIPIQNTNDTVITYRQYFIMNNYDSSERHKNILDSCACVIADSLYLEFPRAGIVSFYYSSEITNSESLCKDPKQFIKYSSMNDFAFDYSFNYYKGISGLVHEIGKDTQVKSTRKIACKKRETSGY